MLTTFTDTNIRKLSLRSFTFITARNSRGGGFFPGGLHPGGVCLGEGLHQGGPPGGGSASGGSASGGSAWGWGLHEERFAYEGPASRGEVCIQWGGQTPQSDTTGYGQRTDTVNEREVHILLECILVIIKSTKNISRATDF